MSNKPIYPPLDDPEFMEAFYGDPCDEPDYYNDNGDDYLDEPDYEPYWKREGGMWSKPRFWDTKQRLARIRNWFFPSDALTTFSHNTIEYSTVIIKARTRGWVIILLVGAWLATVWMLTH